MAVDKVAQVACASNASSASNAVGEYFGPLRAFKGAARVANIWSELQSKKKTEKRLFEEAFQQESEALKSAEWTGVVAEEKARRLGREQQHQIADMWSSYASSGLKSSSIVDYIKQQQEEALNEQRFIFRQAGEERERYLASAQLSKQRQLASKERENDYGWEFVGKTVLEIGNTLLSMYTGIPI